MPAANSPSSQYKPPPWPAMIEMPVMTPGSDAITARLTKLNRHCTSSLPPRLRKVVPKTMVAKMRPIARTSIPNTISDCPGTRPRRAEEQQGDQDAQCPRREGRQRWDLQNVFVVERHGDKDQTSQRCRSAANHREQLMPDRGIVGRHLSTTFPSPSRSSAQRSSLRKRCLRHPLLTDLH
jgi:hypothetical protein